MTQRRQKKILLLSSDLSISGGIPRYTKYQINVLKEMGSKIYLSTGFKIGELYKDNIFEKISSLNLTHGKNLSFYDKSNLVINTLKLLIKEKIDLILVNHLSLSPIARLGNILIGIPYITNIYGSELWTDPKKVEIISLKNSNAIIGDSIHTIDYGVNYLGLKRGKTFLIYDPVNLERFKPINWRDTSYIYEKYLVPKGRKILLTLSRLDRFKGHEMIIDIINKLGDEVIYVIAGTGKKEDSLKKIAKAKGELGGKIHFIGFIEEEDLAAIYNIADIFILISKKEKMEGEGLPLSLIEASACQKPIIAGDEDGSAEAVIDGVNGFIVSPRDNNKLLEVVQSLLTNEKVRIKMGKEGRKVVSRNFNYLIFKDKLMKVINDIGT